jgi:HPt (histidine-containing phosphotransfer) domain-containing protein
MDLLTELIECFLDTAPDRLEELRLGVKQQDTKAIERAAHNLRGSSGTIDRVARQDPESRDAVEAGPLVELCTTLESMAKTGSMEGSEALLIKVETEFERIRQRLCLRQSKHGGS